MKNLILIIALAAALVLGYFAFDRFDKIMDKIRKEWSRQSYLYGIIEKKNREEGGR